MTRMNQRRQADGTKRPPRIEARPLPENWKADELLTLDEAAALFWPDGPLTVTSLRTAVRNGQLDVAEIAGKLFTTTAGIARMSVCKPRFATDTISADPPASEPQSVAEMQRLYLNRLRS
jgi:hypothetical protein